MTEANISADAQPAARAIRRLVIISCPAPFERLEAQTPTIGDRTARKPYEDQNIRGASAAGFSFEHNPRGEGGGVLFGKPQSTLGSSPKERIRAGFSSCSIRLSG
jgi:hypothetical protein